MFDVVVAELATGERFGVTIERPAWARIGRSEVKPVIAVSGTESMEALALAFDEVGLYCDVWRDPDFDSVVTMIELDHVLFENTDADDEVSGLAERRALAVELEGSWRE